MAMRKAIKYQLRLWSSIIACTGGWSGEAHSRDAGCLPALIPYHRAIASSPLVLEPRHSIDFLDMDGAITDEEIGYTIMLWEADEFHADPNTLYGYAPGPGIREGARHSADRLDPAWSLGTVELNRQLASWRAGRYREHTNSWDGFVPVWSHAYAPVAATYTSVHYVDSNSLSPVPPYASPDTAARTIQDALNVALAGSVVRVAAGIYSEGGASTPYGDARVAITNAIRLESLEGPDRTAIIGQLSPPLRGAILDHPGAVLRGFTIMEASSPGSGDSIEIRNGGGVLGLALAEISDCRITRSSALPWGSGGGLALHSVSGIVRRVELSANEARSGGGAIILWGHNTIVENCVVKDNYASTSGGGMLIDNSRQIRNTLVHGNQANLQGGGVTLANNSDLWNTTVTGNRAPAAAGVLFSGQGSRVLNSIVVSNPGGDIHAAAEVNVASVLHTCSSAILHPAITISNHLQATPSFFHPLLSDYRILDPDDDVQGAGLWAAWMQDAVDLDGAPRLSTDGTVSLGAYQRPDIVFSPSAPSQITGGEPFALSLLVQWPQDVGLGALAIDFDLPDEWSLHSVSGDAAPAIQHHTVVFLGKPTGSVVTAVVEVVSHPVESATVQLSAWATWQLFGMSDSVGNAIPAVEIEVASDTPEVLIEAFAGPNGVATPPIQSILLGASASVLVEADPYFYIDALRVEGESVLEAIGLEAYTLLLPEVEADTTIEAFFAPHTTVHDVPLHWLAAYGLTNQTPEEAALDDPDGDGVPTWQEFIAGTSPIDPDDVFVLDSVTDTSASDGVTIAWPSVADRVYTIYHTNDLTTGEWVEIATDILATPPMNVYPLPETETGSFYRISVNLAP